MTDVLVRVERRDGTTQVIRLTPSAPSFVVEAVPRALQITRRLSRLGIDPKPAYAASESAAAYVIGSVTAFWLIDRTLTFVT